MRRIEGCLLAGVLTIVSWTAVADDSQMAAVVVCEEPAPADVNHPPWEECDEDDPMNLVGRVQDLLDEARRILADATHETLVGIDITERLVGLPGCGEGIPPGDTDGDGVLDPWDEDDDCDRLEDEFEANVMGTDNKTRDTDDDGVWDGIDLAPVDAGASLDSPNPGAGAGLTIRLKVKSIETTKGVDFFIPFIAEKWQWIDPFVHHARVYIQDGQPPVGDFRIPGLNEDDHPHNAKNVAIGDRLKDEDAIVDLPEDGLVFGLDSAGRLRFSIEIQLRDHDIWWDDKIDLDAAVNSQDTVRYDGALDDLVGKVQHVEFSGLGDGSENDSARLKAVIGSNVDGCALRVLRQIREGVPLVTDC